MHVLFTSVNGIKVKVYIIYALNLESDIKNISYEIMLN